MKHCSACKWNNLLCRFSWAAACVLLAGCASLPRPATDEVKIKVVGVLTVKADGHPVRRLRLTWERIFAADGVRDVVEIKTPLGNTYGRLQSDAEGVSVVIAGRPLAAAAPLWKMLQKLPPPKSMGYWLLGASDPDYSTRELFVPGSVGVHQIVQHNWQITYSQRDDEGRPQRIELLRQAPAADAAANIAATMDIVRWLSPS